MSQVIAVPSPTVSWWKKALPQPPPRWLNHPRRKLWKLFLMPFNMFYCKSLFCKSVNLTSPALSHPKSLHSCLMMKLLVNTCSIFHVVWFDMVHRHIKKKKKKTFWPSSHLPHCKPQSDHFRENLLYSAWLQTVVKQFELVYTVCSDLSVQIFTVIVVYNECLWCLYWITKAHTCTGLGRIFCLYMAYIFSTEDHTLA